MKTTERRHNQPQPAAGRGGASLQSPQGAQIAQLEAAIEASPAMVAQRELAGIVHDSPRQAAQAKMFDSIHNSPRQAAQAKAFAAIHGSPAQTAQRQKLERLFNRPAQRQEAEEPLQTKPETAQREEARPNHTGLPDDLKSGIESLSGLSMDNVRVHYNSSQPAQLNAHAYAQGTDIHVAPGQEKHLPHEAWHVVQQAQGRVRPTMQMKGGTPVNDDAGLEHEADVMGARALQMTGGPAPQPLDPGVGKQGGAAWGTVQRTVTQITPGKDDKIGKVLIVGRPERVFGGSMGDHTTAFATHVEAIKLRMEGQSLEGAREGLSDMYAAAKTLPGYAELKENLPSEEAYQFGRRRPHGNRLQDAEAKLTKLLDALKQVAQEAQEGWQTAFALMLQQCVNAYLEFRELIPLSAVNVMSVSPGLAGKGKGEAGHAGTLAQYERGMTSETGGLQQAIEGTFDIHAAAMVVATTDAGTLAGLAPGVTVAQTPMQRATLLAKQHAMAIRAGFPKSYAASGFDPNGLVAAILEQAKSQIVREKERLLRRYAFRWADWDLHDKTIKAGMDTTKKYVRERDSLGAEIVLYKIQIKGIDEVLKEETELPEKSTGISLKEESVPSVDKAETAKAEQAEEEALEEEVKKQPVATQIVFSNDMFKGIHSIEIEGRPPSPIPGSMGAHSTAWLVHTDRVKKALLGATVPNALKIMNEQLVPEARALEKSLAKANPPTVHGQEELAAQAWKVLEARTTKKAEDYGSPSRLAFELQQYINELLTYINYIPGVTREAVDTTGHGEGSHRKVLVEFEKETQSLLNDLRIKAELRARKNKGRAPKKVRQPKLPKISEDKYDELKTAVAGLLDLKGLGSREVYREVHWRLIKDTYPHVGQAIEEFEK